MDLKDRLRRAAGLFVELPPDQTPRSSRTEDVPSSDTADTDSSGDYLSALGRASQPLRTVEQVVRDADGPNLDAIGLAGAANVTPLAPGADFTAIYEQAGLPQAQFTAEQATEMLRSLPPELPLAMRRQTMTVALNSMGRALGATPETIVADASRKLAALAAYGDAVGQQTTALLVQKEQEIAALQGRIEAHRAEITSAQESLAQTLKSCHDEADRIDDVLEFFSLDVPPSRHSGAGQ